MSRRVSNGRPLGQRNPSTAKAWMRGCAVLAATLMFASAVRGDPSSPFGGSQSFETASPKGSDWQDGDRGVVEERGAATYSYSFPLPPGRGGAVPSVSLNYSSAAPLRGGVAAGWSLDVGSTLIEIDDSAGIGNLRYTVGGARLVEVSDAKFYTGSRTFRVLWDASFTRYVLHHPATGPDYWVVGRSDGSNATYDHFSFGRQWRLTSVEDAFGNRMDYTWSTVSTGPDWFAGVDLAAIEYSSYQRPSLSGPPIAANARVVFNYRSSLEFCTNANGTLASRVPIGADLRFATTTSPYKGYLSGARRLVSIASYVKDAPSSTAWRPVRVASLSYDMNALRCDQAAAPLRYITEMRSHGFVNGAIQVSPVIVKFGYGPQVQSHAGSEVSVAAIAQGGVAGNLSGETHALQDVDGDGRQDLIWIDQRHQAATGRNPARTVCQLNWIRGAWGGGYEWDLRQTDLPTAPWSRAAATPSNNHPNATAPYFERCTLGGQHFVRQEVIDVPGCSRNLFIRNRVGYHFLDWNGDGRVDILTNLWKAGKYNPDLVPYSDNNGTITCDGANQQIISGFNGPECGCKEGYTKDANGECSFQPESGGTGVEALIGAGAGPVGLPPQTEGGCDLQRLEEPFPEHIVLGNRTMHIWRVYSGTGSSFAGSLTKVYSPLELPTPGTEGQYAHSDASSTLQSITDVDGDGWLDVIATPPTCHGSECNTVLGPVAALIVGKSLNGGSSLSESGVYKRIMTLMAPTDFNFLVLLNSQWADPSRLGGCLRARAGAIKG